jgi:hypothetical protein
MNNNEYRLGVPILLTCLLMFGLFSGTENGPSADSVLPQHEADKVTARDLGLTPEPSFTKNVGQLSTGGGLYYALGKDLSVSFDDGWIAYHLHRTGSPVTSLTRVEFLNSNPSIPKGVHPSSQITSFFMAAGSYSDVGNYREVLYENLWDGVDMRVYFRDGALKYEFHVVPGTDPSVIQLHYIGVDGLSIDWQTGELQVDTPGGRIVDASPVAYQECDDRPRIVSTAFHLHSNVVSFDLGSYDPSLPLVIDPGVVFSTYIGMDGIDNPARIWVDEGSSCYVAGTNHMDTFPVTPGAYWWNRSSDHGFFLLKINANLSTLEFSAFIGMDSPLVARDLALDDDGNIYLVAHSDGSGAPVTEGCYDNSTNGVTDGILMKFNPNATQLLFCTLFGGSKYDFPFGIAVDGSGSAIIVGETGSSDFPTTTNAYDDTLDGGTAGFLIRISRDGSELEYSTLLDGSKGDECQSVSLRPSGEVLIFGRSSSDNFPTTVDAVDRTFNGWVDCVFIEFDIDSSSILYSTYLGGSELDAPDDMALDGDGHVYMTGITYSSNFPTTTNAHDKRLGGINDGFIVKLNTSSSRWDYSTYLGGSNSDYMQAIHVDSEKRAAVTGIVRSADFPMTENAISDTLGGGQDACVSILSMDGSTLEYSSYLGGSGSEDGKDIWKDPEGLYFVVGETRSTDYPTTKGVYDNLYANTGDVFVTRVDIERPWVVSSEIPDELTTGDPYQVELETLDNFGVAEVTMEYWVDDEDVHMNATLVEGPRTGDSVNWTLSTVAPNNRIGNMNFIFHVLDLAKNVNISLNGSIPLRDNDGPVLIIDPPPNDGYGMEFNVTVSVTDNIAVDTVRLRLWFGPNTTEPVLVQMEQMDVGPEYLATVSAPLGFAGRMSYVAEATDTSGNQGRTFEIVSMIRDDISPEFIRDLSDIFGTTGDPFQFRADVRDNIAVEAVHVLYWYGNQGKAASTNLSLVPSDVTGSGNGTYVSEDFVMPWGFVGKCHYSFLVADTSGNWINTPPASVEVFDNDGPELMEDLSSTNVTTGDLWTVLVQVRDNIGVTSVALHHNVPGIAMKRIGLDAFTIDDRGNGTYRIAIDVPNDWTGPLNYSFEMNDVNRNQNFSDSVSLIVVDDEAPALGPVGTEPADSGVKGLEVEVEAEATDNVGPLVLFTEFWFGDGEHMNISMVIVSQSYPTPHYYYSATIEVPRQADGPMWYVVSARDGQGNWASTSVFSLDLINIPPAVDGIPDWTVVEEEVTRLDISSYVMDGNDPIESLSMEADHSGISCEGLVLVAMFESWTPTTTVTIVVTDGEHSITTDFQLTITNVNDPPVITDLSPPSGSVYEKVDRIDLQANCSDEDGDTVTVTWMDGDEVLGTGSFLRVGGFGAGRHTITALASDGTDTTAQSLEIIVEEDSKTSSSTTYLILLAVISIVVAVSAVYLFRKRNR